MVFASTIGTPNVEFPGFTCYHVTMTTVRHYKHAPIVEAVIDFRVSLPERISLENLAQIQISDEGKYPQRAEQVEFKVEATLEEDSSPASARTRLGYIFTSADKHQSFQARLDGFMFSRRAPYHNWSSFRSEAHRLWNRYRSVARPETVTRVAVRYVNRLDLPLPIRDFKDYLRTFPEVSSDLPQALSNFFMRVEIPQEDIGAMLILNEAILPSDSTDMLPVLLDIDLFRASDLPATEDGLWRLMEQLHMRKNEIFEACINERTRRLIR